MAGVTGLEEQDSDFLSGLCKTGGIAALIAGVLFRRNLAAEIGLFVQQEAPVNVAEWFELLQRSRILGLAYLHVFDLVNYGLLMLVFLALFVVLRKAGKSSMTIAVVLGLIGIGIYFASNSSFSMVSLSDQFSAATGETERVVLLSAGQGVLAGSRFTSPGGHPGAGGFISLFFVAAAGMIITAVMVRGRLFNKAAVVFGFLANGFDLAYCAAFLILPMMDGELLSVLFIPAAGAFYMVWHILIGLRLLKLGRLRNKNDKPTGVG